MPVLRIKQAGHSPVVHRLYKKITSIGSAADCDVQIRDSEVEVTHCHIHFDGRIFHLAPIGRDAKMSVNGKKRKKHDLAHKDVVRIGKTDIDFLIHDDSAFETSQNSASPQPSPYQTILSFRPSCSATTNSTNS